MSLHDLCVRYLEAYAELYGALPEGSNIGVHTGTLLGVVGRHGGTITAHFAAAPATPVNTPLANLTPPTAPFTEASAPAAEPKKRGRPPKADAPAPTTPAPAEEKPAEAWTPDKLRALARQVRDKHGLEVARATVGCPIDELKPEAYAKVAADLHAKLAAEKGAAPKAADEL
jgi:hypothetical protein